MMDKVIEKIVDRRNLYFAWEKLKKALVPGDIWFDEIDLARFEANLENELSSIIIEISSGSYISSPLIPIGYPKAKKDGKTQTRQTFYVSLRDQLTWIAVVNIIGPDLDHQMPFWSFGNRLYRSVWFDGKQNKKELRIGWYRHANGFIYRKWSQSWPRYRRAISLTSKVMAHNKSFKDESSKFKNLLINDSQESLELEVNDELPDELKNKYWFRDYWTKELSGKVFWASIDLEKFYPSIKTECILKNFQQFFSQRKQTPALLNLISTLLNFRINYNDWQDHELEEINLKEKPENYSNIPTGLLVAGFLANLALLEIDNEVSIKLLEKRNISHFRFVDDHVILSDNFDDLVKWIVEYQQILQQKQVGAKLNISKTEPNSLQEYLSTKDSNNDEVENRKKKAEEETELDPVYPSPLMTQTLVKVSNINKTEFDLLDDQEEDNLIADLQHLLLSNFPDHELRKDTRVSFAATMLSRLVPKKIEEMYDIYQVNNELFPLKQKKTKLEKKLKEEVLTDTKRSKLKTDLELIDKTISSKEAFLAREKQRIKENQSTLRNTIFRLLKKAVVENHQKVRLWSRLIEYNFHSGNHSSEEILKSIEELQNKECSELSSHFIYSLALSVFAHKFIEAAKLCSNDNISFAKKETAKGFIESCLDKRFNDRVQLLSTSSNKFYLNKSISLYKFALGSGIHLLKTQNTTLNNPQNYVSLIDEYNLANWENGNLVTWIKENGEDPENMIWWLLKKTTNQWDEKPNIFWSSGIKFLDLSSSNSWSIISQYPMYIPVDIKNAMAIHIKLTSKYITSEGWMHALNSKPDEINTEKPNLFDWVNWMKKRTVKLDNSELIFDPRLSEWTALNIISKILEKIEYTEDPFYWFTGINPNLSRVHPSNYFIPKDWLLEKDVDWNSWKETFKNSKIEIKENAISDFRFTPNDSIFQNIEQNIVFGLANLLLGLLCKNFGMPYIWNVYGQQQSFLYLASKKLEKISVSSYTFGIIESCFSLRSIDTKFIKSYQDDLRMGPDFTDDSISDMLNIDSFATLRLHLSRAINILERYQINVQDNLPRQLIPINLLQNSRKNNFLSEEIPDSQIN